jgi:hypothetical protein
VSVRHRTRVAWDKISVLQKFVHSAAKKTGTFNLRVAD